MHNFISTQQIFASSKSTIKKLKNGTKYIQVNNKDIFMVFSNEHFQNQVLFVHSINMLSAHFMSLPKCQWVVIWQNSVKKCLSRKLLFSTKKDNITF